MIAFKDDVLAQVREACDKSTARLNAVYTEQYNRSATNVQQKPSSAASSTGNDNTDTPASSKPQTIAQKLREEQHQRQADDHQTLILEEQCNKLRDKIAKRQLRFDLALGGPPPIIPRTKTHWDYVLDEMQFMAIDFRQEYRWKLASARATANMCCERQVAFFKHMNQETEDETEEEETSNDNNTNVNMNQLDIRCVQKHMSTEQVSKLKSVASCISLKVSEYWATLCGPYSRQGVEYRQKLQKREYLLERAQYEKENGTSMDVAEVSGTTTTVEEGVGTTTSSLDQVAVKKDEKKDGNNYFTSNVLLSSSTTSTTRKQLQQAQEQAKADAAAAVYASQVEHIVPGTFDAFAFAFLDKIVVKLMHTLSSSDGGEKTDTSENAIKPSHDLLPHQKSVALKMKTLAKLKVGSFVVGRGGMGKTTAVSDTGMFWLKEATAEYQVKLQNQSSTGGGATDMNIDVKDEDASVADGDGVRIPPVVKRPHLLILTPTRSIFRWLSEVRTVQPDVNVQVWTPSDTEETEEKMKNVDVLLVALEQVGAAMYEDKGPLNSIYTKTISLEICGVILDTRDCEDGAVDTSICEWKARNRYQLIQQDVKNQESMTDTSPNAVSEAEGTGTAFPTEVPPATTRPKGRKEMPWRGWMGALAEAIESIVPARRCIVAENFPSKETLPSFLSILIPTSTLFATLDDMESADFKREKTASLCTASYWSQWIEHCLATNVPATVKLQPTALLNHLAAFATVSSNEDRDIKALIREEVVLVDMSETQKSKYLSLCSLFAKKGVFKGGNDDISFRAFARSILALQYVCFDERLITLKQSRGGENFGGIPECTDYMSSHTLSRLVNGTSPAEASLQDLDTSANAKFVALNDTLTRFQDLRVLLLVEKSTERVIVHNHLRKCNIDHIHAGLLERGEQKDRIGGFLDHIASENAIFEHNQSQDNNSCVILGTTDALKTNTLNAQGVDVIIVLSENYIERESLNIYKAFRMRLMAAGKSGDPITVVRIRTRDTLEETLTINQSSLSQCKGMSLSQTLHIEAETLDDILGAASGLGGSFEGISSITSAPIGKAASLASLSTMLPSAPQTLSQVVYSSTKEIEDMEKSYHTAMEATFGSAGVGSNGGPPPLLDVAYLHDFIFNSKNRKDPDVASKRWIEDSLYHLQWEGAHFASNMKECKGLHITSRSSSGTQARVHADLRAQGMVPPYAAICLSEAFCVVLQQAISQDITHKMNFLLCMVSIYSRDLIADKGDIFANPDTAMAMHLTHGDIAGTFSSSSMALLGAQPGAPSTAPPSVTPAADASSSSSDLIDLSNSLASSFLDYESILRDEQEALDDLARNRLHASGAFGSEAEKEFWSLVNPNGSDPNSLTVTPTLGISSSCALAFREILRECKRRGIAMDSHLYVNPIQNASRTDDVNVPLYQRSAHLTDSSVQIVYKESSASQTQHLRTRVNRPQEASMKKRLLEQNGINGLVLKRNRLEAGETSAPKAGAGTIWPYSTVPKLITVSIPKSKNEMELVTRSIWKNVEDDVIICIQSVFDDPQFFLTTFAINRHREGLPERSRKRTRERYEKLVQTSKFHHDAKGRLAPVIASLMAIKGKGHNFSSLQLWNELNTLASTEDVLAMVGLSSNPPNANKTPAAPPSIEQKEVDKNTMEVVNEAESAFALEMKLEASSLAATRKKIEAMVSAATAHSKSRAAAPVSSNKPPFPSSPAAGVPPKVLYKNAVGQYHSKAGVLVTVDPNNLSGYTIIDQSAQGTPSQPVPGIPQGESVTGTATPVTTTATTTETGTGLSIDISKVNSDSVIGSPDERDSSMLSTDEGRRVLNPLEVLYMWEDRRSSTGGEDRDSILSISPRSLSNTPIPSEQKQNPPPITLTTPAN